MPGIHSVFHYLRSDNGGNEASKGRIDAQELEKLQAAMSKQRLKTADLHMLERLDRQHFTEQAWSTFQQWFPSIEGGTKLEASSQGGSLRAAQLMVEFAHTSKVPQLKSQDLKALLSPEFVGVSTDLIDAWLSDAGQQAVVQSGRLALMLAVVRESMGPGWDYFESLELLYSDVSFLIAHADNAADLRDKDQRNELAASFRSILNPSLQNERTEEIGSITSRLKLLDSLEFKSELPSELAWRLRRAYRLIFSLPQKLELAAKGNFYRASALHRAWKSVRFGAGGDANYVLGRGARVSLEDHDRFKAVLNELASNVQVIGDPMLKIALLTRVDELQNPGPHALELPENGWKLQHVQAGKAGRFDNGLQFSETDARLFMDWLETFTVAALEGRSGPSLFSLLEPVGMAVEFEYARFSKNRLQKEHKQNAAARSSTDAAAKGNEGLSLLQSMEKALSVGEAQRILRTLRGRLYLMMTAELSEYLYSRSQFEIYTAIAEKLDGLGVDHTKVFEDHIEPWKRRAEQAWLSYQAVKKMYGLVDVAYQNKNWALSPDFDAHQNHIDRVFNDTRADEAPSFFRKIVDPSLIQNTQEVQEKWHGLSKVRGLDPLEWVMDDAEVSVDIMERIVAEASADMDALEDKISSLNKENTRTFFGQMLFLDSLLQRARAKAYFMSGQTRQEVAKQRALRDHPLVAGYLTQPEEQGYTDAANAAGAERRAWEAMMERIAILAERAHALSEHCLVRYRALD